MAEDQLTAEEMEQIQELLANLDQPPTPATFSPMQEQFTADMQELNPEPEDPFAGMGDEQTDQDADIDPGLTEDGTGSPAETGDLADLGDAGEAPTETGDFGDLGDLGDLADLGDVGEAPADTGDFGDLGDLADLGGAGDAPADTGDFGDFGDLGDLGDAPAADGSDFGDDSSAGDFGDLGDLDSAGTTTVDDGDLGDLDLGDLGTDSAMDAGPTGEDLELSGLDDLGDLGGDSDVAATPMDSAGDIGDIGDLSLDTSDLADMEEQARLQTGIGDEFTDEDLANIRQALLDYPPGIKRSVIDVVVNEKISPADQRLLMNMVIDQAEADQVADFIEARLGYRPDLTPSQVTKDGVQIIYADELSPEALARKRRRNKLILLSAAAGFLVVCGIFATILFYNQFQIEGQYEAGLEELYAARKSTSERQQHYTRALEYYNAALKASGDRHNVEYMNKYGIAFMRAGFYEDAFAMLFGRVEPRFGEEKADSAWSYTGRRAPLIRMADGSRWPDPEDYRADYRPMLVERDGIVRKVIEPGAYITDRLRDEELNRQTLINLARFHSNRARNFIESEEGRRFKNDELALDYYRLILTLMNRPDDVEAIAGMGEIYYNQKEFAAAAREYNRIIDKHPMEIKGHAGLLHTYIEIWRKTNDPRLVLAKHRELRQLGLEEDL
ncbi:MAG: hypothetical protein KDK27_00685, partial [Leptospiraceae bacterium]|nr:hypothetical protein [Leptospiraceae bacterium]